ncbi:MAG: heme lyase CcmF/NrfE family subunit [Reyranellaceae bacterium]
MIPELGHFALVLALAIALVQSLAPLIGAQRNEPALVALARPAALAQFAFVAFAFACLTWSYVVSDFSVLNVVENSHSAKPLLYKITGVWGNHEGSLLLWILVLSLFGAAIALFGRNLPPPLRARVLAVQAMIGVGFLLFILLTSNPFLRVDPAPFDGNDLNPVLQDPGLAFHPPFLYLGYVGFSVTFAFAVAALIEGRVDPAWARWVRPWALAAWCALTLGIALGSWWAYYELGWGGFWFWDPVENASFLPWLAGTALLHSAIVVEKRDALKAWTVLLAILAFSLSLLGTFLVRSGVLTSVHAFATDPGRGLFVLALLAIAIGGSFALYAWRAPQLKGGGLFAPVSREGGLLLNNLLLCTGCATVLLGTLYPLFLDVLGGGKVSVGPPFYNATFVPLMLPLLIAVPVGAMLPWKRGDLFGALKRLRVAAGITLAVALVLALAIDRHSTLALIGLVVAAWLVLGSLAELAERIGLFRLAAAESWRRLAGLPRAALGMSIAHASLGILVAGVTAASAWQQERVLVMRPGDATELAGYGFTLQSVGNAAGPNYQALRAAIVVRDGSRTIATLHPERRLYGVQKRQTTEAAIHTTWLADLYTVIGDQDEAGWTVRLYHNPLAPWIWIGAVLCVLGGLVSLSDRRHRVGAPSRPRKLVVAAAE